MKKALLIFALLIIGLTGFAQEGPSNQQRIAQIDAEIKKAVASQDYQKASDLQKEKKIRKDIEEALQAQDYRSAAALQKQLKEVGSGKENKINELKQRLQKAIDQEQYAEAARLKKEIEHVKNGGSSTTLSSPAVTSTTSYSSSAIPEPEFDYQVAYYSQKNNRLTPLEKETPELKTSGWAAPGYAQSTSSYVLEDERSPVRFKSGNGLTFIVRIPAGIDPSDYFRLVKFEVSRGRRHMKYFTASGTGWGGGDAGSVSEFDQPISFKRIKDDTYCTYLITPDSALDTGEYTFYYIGNKMYAFGIN